MSVDFSICFARVRLVRGRHPRKLLKHSRFSGCCIWVKRAARPLAGILSPQRLPFRHPGRAGTKNSMYGIFAQRLGRLEMALAAAQLDTPLLVKAL
jgi:hypothetical protein